MPLDSDTAAKATANAVNRELQTFSRWVADDLRAPLYQLAGFTYLLRNDSTALDEDAVRHLDRIQEAVDRVTQLMEDLIRFARITHSELKRSSVDLSQLARDIADKLRRTLPRRTVEFVVEDGLITDASGDLMRILFENLLGNAFRSTARRVGGRIEVGVRIDAQEFIYFVRDNGEDLNPSCAGGLSGGFARQYSRKDHRETKIGLNTVRKIVELHGGRIWAEGTSGRGAIICFSLRQCAAGGLKTQ